MLTQIINDNLKRKGFFCTGTRSIPWQQLMDQAIRWRELLEPRDAGRVLIVPESAETTLALLIALSELPCEILLLPPGPPHETHIATFDADLILRAGRDFHLVIDDKRSANWRQVAATTTGSITLFTSGTTGPPRPHRWSWAHLCSQIKGSGPASGGAWISAYPIDTFAGLQAMLYAMAFAETLVLLEAGQSLGDVVAWNTHYSLVMATPTFWRRVLLLEDRERLSHLSVATLSMGGEAVTQDLLNALQETFPLSRQVHIYASSEAGSVFSVSDGRAGFPSAWLNRPLSSGLIISEQNGELYVTRPDSKAIIKTGDAIEIIGDRVFFVGRTAEQINVGGRKVNPIYIETALRAVAGVADAYAYGLPSSMTGHVVAADLVLCQGYASQDVAKTLHSYFRDRHPAYERPRQLRFLSSLPTTRSGKVLRKTTI